MSSVKQENKTATCTGLEATCSDLFFSLQKKCRICGENEKKLFACGSCKNILYCSSKNIFKLSL